MSGIGDWFAADWMLAEAGDGAFARGAVYEREGRVTIRSQQPDRVEATVRGPQPYVVELSVEHGHPAWYCTCPAADDGSLCKHAVATALALTRHPVEAPEQPSDDQPGPEPAGGATGTVPAPDVGEWRKRVTRAFAAGGRFVDYQRAARWAEGVHDVLDELQQLLNAGHAEAVLTLAEHAHRRAETALNRIDDSAGWLTDISGRIAELHRAAARSARPSPRPFAKRLFDLETSSHTLDTFHRAAAVYADVLGDEGIARYRQLVDDAWEAADHTGPRWDTFRLQQARIAVAIAAGDPDELIALKQDDLNSPHDYLEIAQALADAGRVDDAIDWARRGLDTYADRWHQTPKLRDWLAQTLTDHDRADETEALYWDAFVRRPTLGGYRQLIDHATEPDDASTKAITYLDNRIGTPVGRGHVYPADVLIEILAHDGEHDRAWTLYQQHGCTHDLAMRLAKRREFDHPLEAIDVYLQDVEQHIDRKNKTGYRAAIRQLAHIRDLAERAGRPDVAAGIIEHVRTEHRLKRTLMTLLDKARLGGE